MAIIKIKQIREMKLEEVTRKISELRLDLFKEMGNVKMGRPIKNPGRIKELRRTISRLLTVKKEISKREVKK
ncbi:MAG TPA: 50S ribosomal protein L29 [archaeon]|nr:50S ribosomal protein L29 [archaeon]